MTILESYGYNAAPEQNGKTVMRITAEHRERYALVGNDGPGFGRLGGSAYYGHDLQPFPTVGDFVLVDRNAQGDHRIVETLPRKSLFQRPDPSYGRQRPQALAANFDTVFITLSLNRDFNVKKLDRYLTLTLQSGAQPVIVLTKLDLRTPGWQNMVRTAQDAAFGAPVCPLSAMTGEQMEQLAPYLFPGQTIALMGSSGAGKSSLINALAGKPLMETGAVRQGDARGRHTTTYRQLLQLDSGVLVIDTPGMRELGMWDVTEGLDHAFLDIAALAGQCRFSDCSHQKEPGCAVQRAIQAGQLHPDRLVQYRKLQREAKFTDDRGSYLRDRLKEAKQRSKPFRNRKGID